MYSVIIDFHLDISSYFKSMIFDLLENMMDDNKGAHSATLSTFHANNAIFVIPPLPCVTLDLAILYQQCQMLMFHTKT